MPTLKEEILLMIKEGIITFLNLRSLYNLRLGYNSTTIYSSVNRLAKDGLIEKFKREKRIYFRLTEKGSNYIQNHLKSSEKSVSSWDGKWRLVIFDVPEEKGKLRTFLRDYLKILGFGKVQRSVWISPYDFENKVAYFAKKLKISDYIFQLSVNNFRGLNGKEIAQLFWDTDSLQSKYADFIQKYSTKLNHLLEAEAKKSEKHSILITRFLSNLLWDYRSILAHDPHLSPELLPPDWAGDKASSFVKKCLSAFPKNSPSIKNSNRY